MTDRKIAKRYARAVMAIALEQNGLDRFQAELAALRDLLTVDSDLLELLQNPLISAEDQQQLFERLIGMTDVSEDIRSLARLLLKNGRIGTIAALVEQFDLLADEQRGDVKVSVVSAVNLPENKIDHIRCVLYKRMGKNINIEKVIDPSLVGGALLRIGNRVVDGTVRSKLSQMKESLG